MTHWRALVDGQWSSTIPVDDRGFLYGDHLFETMLMTSDRVPLWALHWERLSRGCSELSLGVPEQACLEDDLSRLMDGHPGVVRLTVSRGSSASGYWPPKNGTVRRVVTKQPWTQGPGDDSEPTLRVGIVRERLPVVTPGQGMKHGNRLVQVKSAVEMQRQHFNEGLIFRTDGHLAEAISGNVILVRDSVFITPDCPEVCGVGLTALKTGGLAVEARSIEVDEVWGADEVMVVNAIRGPQAVMSVDQHTYGVGQGFKRAREIWDGLMQ